MDLQITHRLDRFGGIDNVNLPTEMEQVDETGHTYFFQQANNLDLTNKRHMRRRDGHRTIHTFNNVKVHSLWSYGNDCFFVAGDTLYRLNVDLSYTSMLTGLINTPMNYADVFGKIYFTNNVTIGWIDSYGVSSLPAPTDNFKISMPPGHLIEFYNQVLYVASGNILYCSDPAIPAQYDYRQGLIPFKSRITMLKAVDDGLWVSDSEGIYFLNGNTIFDFAFHTKLALPAIERSAVSIDGRFLGTDSKSKNVLMLTSGGICIGSNGGGFLVPTEDRYHGSEFFIVDDAAIRIVDDRYQYLVMGHDYQSDAPIELLAGLQNVSVESGMSQPWSLSMFKVDMTATLI